MTISGERTEELDIFCHITGFMSDFLSFIDAELFRFFHGAIQLCYVDSRCYMAKACAYSCHQWEDTDDFGEFFQISPQQTDSLS